jgi:hypothetical protein
METVETIALIMGVAWASGINLYATILVLGWMGGLGHIELPPDLHIITDPSVMFAAGIMFFIEFFADKTPGVDTGWDAIHTFVRIPAGALMAAGASGHMDLGPAAELVALLLGGSLATASHVTKTSSRILINTSPEPVSNWTASITEDLLVIGGLWTALHYPMLFLVGLTIFIMLVIWLLPKLWRTIRRIIGRIGRWLKGQTKHAPSSSLDDQISKLSEQRRRLVHRQADNDGVLDTDLPPEKRTD